MMQSCASAAKLRGGGPILCYGVISHQYIRVPIHHWHVIECAYVASRKNRDDTVGDLACSRPGRSN